MKKLLLLTVFAIFCTANFSFGQVTFVTAPVGSGATTQVRAPNGLSTHTFMRASTVVLTSELASIPNSTSITSFGFVTTAGADVPVTGTLTVYMLNTTSNTYTRGTDWATIISGMTQVYSGDYTIPDSATNVDLTLTTPFTYTGGSIFLAYDFTSTGPFGTAPATYAANNTVAASLVSAASATAAPTTLGSTAFRPTFRFGFPNTLTNDVSVEGINSLGNIANVISTSAPISAVVKNNSNTTLTNINVTATVTGSNTYTNSQTIASLASGATATVNFSAWTPSALGANVITVSVPSDQVNTNNTRTFNSTVTCNTEGASQNPVSYNSGVGFNTGSGIIATNLQPTVATTITGVNLFIASATSNTGNTIRAVVMNSTGTILGSSADYVIAAGDLNTLKAFTFSPAISVAANELVRYGIAQTANATTGYFPIATYANPNLTTPYFTAALTGGTTTALTTNLGQMGIEAVVSGTCTLGTDTVNALDYKFSISPNPTSGLINVSNNDGINVNEITVTDLNGRIVKTNKFDNVSNIQVNISDLSAGVYMMNIKSEQGNATKKIIKQ